MNDDQAARIYAAMLRRFDAHRQAVDSLIMDVDQGRMLPRIVEVARVLHLTKLTRRRVYLFGNGGSAADAQHWASGLVKYNGISAFALTAEPMILTSIANDDGWDSAFATQVRVHVVEGDIVIGISTSGQSANVANGLRWARKRGAMTVGVTGAPTVANWLAEEGKVDHLLAVNHPVQHRVQEAHTFLGHLLVEVIQEMDRAGNRPDRGEDRATVGGERP